jgi:hypothetical protein
LDTITLIATEISLFIEEIDTKEVIYEVELLFVPHSAELIVHLIVFG